MKSSKFLSGVFAILGSFFLAHTSSAYLQYTYASDTLEWQNTILNGYDYGEEISDDDEGDIAFGFSFKVDEGLVSDTTPTSFIIQSADFFADKGLGNQYGESDLRSLVYGKVIINPDRTIKFWNVIFAVEVKNLADSAYLNKLRDHDIRVISAGGATTCNCDRLWEDLNITTQRPYNTWIIAATLENYYRSDSDISNWSVKQATVSESGSLALVGIGLMGCLFMRRKQRPNFNLAPHCR